MINKNKLGFFLVETMVVIGIVGIIITFLFFTFSNLYTAFNERESFDSIEATNAAAQVRLFLENQKYLVDKELEYEEIDVNNNVEIKQKPYIEITNLVPLNTEYFELLKDRLNISRVYIINLGEFYNENSLSSNDFNVNAKQYLDTLKDDLALYKIFVVTKNNTYGSVSITNYSLVLEGDETKEYLTYVAKGDAFIEPGYEAKDSRGNELDVFITGFVDVNKPGTYYLTYNLGLFSIRRKVIVYEETNNFDYTGTYQTFHVPLDGTYKIELWGAGIANGKGAYTSGEIYLYEGQTLYIYVGEQRKTIVNAESFNGGIANSGGHAGCGATDVRLVPGNWKNFESLKSRIMIAGGGGAGDKVGADAGGITGYDAGGSAKGGSQTLPGVNQSSSYFTPSFGIGGGGCGGGGGYYGGGGASCASGGAGGSSFISGYIDCNSVGFNATNSDRQHTGEPTHYSGYKFYNAIMKSGRDSFNAPDGNNETGHIGDGYARITLIDPNKDNNLSKVRYIYISSNGNSINNHNHYIELQAYDLNGTNVALNKQVRYASYQTGIQSFWGGLVDGVITTSPYITITTKSWVVIDLDKEYDLSSIRLWRYYGDGRYYKESIIKVAGEDGVHETQGLQEGNFRTIDNTQYNETANGKIIRPQGGSNE